MILAIARRELMLLYTTTLPWTVLAAAQCILAWLLFAQLDAYRKIQPDLVAGGSSLGITELVAMPTFNTVALLVLLVAPLFGMQGIAAERRDGRMALFLAPAVSPLAVALGKALGQWLALWPLLALAVLTVSSLLLATPLDTGRVLSAALALGLLALMASTITLWLSGIGTHPAATAAGAYGLLLLLWLLDSGGAEPASWSWFALSPHLAAAFKGLLRVSDLVYYLGISAAAIGLTVHRLWQLGGGR